MLFNSLDFAIFLPIVFILYWFVSNNNLKLQNFLIVFASYVFYGWWDWRFLSLLFFSSLVDYGVGLGLLKQENPTTRKLLLWASIVVNLGMLGFFKYYNFFADNFATAFTWLGHPITDNTLKIILPVGISFYTFQTLSYSIDVYRKKLEPTKDFISFLAFVSFFPQLVAGPIERATHLLPQFYTKRFFDYTKAVDGLRQILWGLFKKMIIADTCAEQANLIFNNSTDYSGSTLALGAVLFAFQIYCDFSGYSDIAIGTARLFGFDLMRNFAFPYFSRDIAEYWRRWHISLSTWFRDYVYIPLGGSKVGTFKKVRNVLIVFLLSGFWHGANWTFIMWGLLNAIYFLPSLLLNTNRKNMEVVAAGKFLPSLSEFFNISLTFTLTVFAWIFFRAESMEHAASYISSICSFSFFTLPDKMIREPLLLVMAFVIVEWLGREHAYAIASIDTRFPKVIKWIVYYCLVLSLFLFTGKPQEFIYFQF